MLCGPRPVSTEVRSAEYGPGCTLVYRKHLARSLPHHGIPSRENVFFASTCCLSARRCPVLGNGRGPCRCVALTLHCKHSTIYYILRQTVPPRLFGLVSRNSTHALSMLYKSVLHRPVINLSAYNLLVNSIVFVHCLTWTCF